MARSPALVSRLRKRTPSKLRISDGRYSALGSIRTVPCHSHVPDLPDTIVRYTFLRLQDPVTARDLTLSQRC